MPRVRDTDGYVHPEFTSLIDVFASNFENGDEVGASFTAYVDGQLVAELYSGFHDTHFKKPYDRDSLQLVFSSSKAITSLAVTYLVDQGHLSYDDLIINHWPEFGAGGKESVTLRDLLTHRAGVNALDVDRVPPFEELVHAFGGERRQAYHAITRGWFLNEVVRRAHPEGKTLGAVIREDILPIIADPNDPTPFEFYFGLPEAHVDRVSRLNGYPIPVLLFKILTPPSIQQWLGLTPIPPFMLKAFLTTGTMSHKTLFKSAPNSGKLWPESYNDARLWHSENPSFSGMTNARTLARLAAFMANNGTLDGKTLIRRETFDVAITEMGHSFDEIIGRETNFVTAGWGHIHNFITPNLTWIGWAGAGGSMIWWNAEHNMAFSYVMNFCDFSAVGDKRSHKLMKELAAVAVKLHEKGGKVNSEGGGFEWREARRASVDEGTQERDEL
ncbi:beta-lactamase/transpeptidase-like protein [Chytridium lagenaria]|nr:beta-lactamase/transpeptidase-like protein [Chytridium lagenaria]